MKIFALHKQILAFSVHARYELPGEIQNLRNADRFFTHNPPKNHLVNWLASGCVSGRINQIIIQLDEAWDLIAQCSRQFTGRAMHPTNEIAKLVEVRNKLVGHSHRIRISEPTRLKAIELLKSIAGETLFDLLEAASNDLLVLASGLVDDPKFTARLPATAWSELHVRAMDLEAFRDVLSAGDMY
jgi:hypothetical protein